MLKRIAFADLLARSARFAARMALCAALMAPLWYAPAAHAAPPAPAQSGAALSPAPGGTPATSRMASLAAEGYAEREWFMRGQAHTYAKNGDWPDDGRWSIKAQPATQPYSTRLLVRAPQDPLRFNGIVIVEWLNTALRFDLDGGWMLTRDEIVREGYAWVGVTAESKGVKWLKTHDAARYAQAAITDDELAYDIYTQAAQAIRQNATALLSVANKPLSANRIKLLAMGYSQSGTFLSTYINALQLQAKAFDGFYLHGTAPVAAPLSSSEWTTFSPHIRPDLNVPVMQLQTEMEVTVSWPLSKTADTDKVRYWEIAGAAHLDRRLYQQALEVAPGSFKDVPPDCIRPTNNLPTYQIDAAALHALRQWVIKGTPPPKAQRMQRNSLGFVQSDSVGNALGGVRLPEIAAPLNHYGMYANFTRHILSAGARYACVAGGSATPLDAADVRARYSSKDVYLQRYKAAADALLQTGFLRPADHAESLRRASQNSLP